MSQEQSTEAPANETENSEPEVDFQAIVESLEGKEETEATPDDDETGAEGTEPSKEAIEAEAPVQPESEPQELASPYLAKMAEMEAKHREALAEREQSIAEREQAARTALIDEIRRNPLAFFEANEFTPEDAEDLALHAYRHKLGDEAPEELVNRTAKSELDRRFLEQEKKLKEMEERFAAQQSQLQAQTILNNIEDFTKAIPDSMPYLADEPADEVVNDIATLYGEIARNGGKPTISECAQMLEAQHAKLAEKYTKRRKATPEPVTEAANTPEPTLTIDSEDISDRTPAAPGREMSDDEIFESVLADLNKVKTG